MRYFFSLFEKIDISDILFQLSETGMFVYEYISDFVCFSLLDPTKEDFPEEEIIFFFDCIFRKNEDNKFVLNQKFIDYANSIATNYLSNLSDRQRAVIKFLHEKTNYSIKSRKPQNMGAKKKDI